MSEPENFLQRWSRRKLAKGDEALSAERDGAQPSPRPESANPQAGGPIEQAPPFDPASLPPIESIDANTDVSVFMRPGVPPELTRAALRRAWSADPAIRDFVGLVESGWDFNDPQAMGGFGPIDPAEVARLVSQAVGEPANPPPGEATAGGATQQTLSGEGQLAPTSGPDADGSRPTPDRHRSVADDIDVQREENDAPQKE